MLENIMNLVNDNGRNATICRDAKGIVVYTDLSAEEKRYDTVEEAKHDLLTRGYYIQ